MKTVYLDVAGKMHSLYRGLLSEPPPGYWFVTRGNWDGAVGRAAGSDAIYSFQEKYLSKAVPVNLAKAYLERFKRPPTGTDLTYATGHVVFRKEPWVVDLEFVTQLAGYSIQHFRRYKRLIEKMLASDYCRKIICWTEAGKRTLILNMDCERFAHKMEVVHLAVPPKKFTRDYGSKDRVRLLFVGSANIPGEFEYKGGKEVLEAFSILRPRYPSLELVIRSDVPQKTREQYRGVEGLQIIDGILPWERLEQEFMSADIFVMPTHATPGLAFLDAMSYELPIVTTDLWANSEMVVDGKTGFTVRESQQVQYYAGNFIPAWDYRAASSFMKSISRVDIDTVKEVAHKVTLLVEDRELRRTMGQAGRWEVESGKYSLNNRQDSLKRTFDEATKT